MTQRFDYVIVGGGSSGCVLANRLSAHPDVRVLLLEAGPADRNPWIHVPGGIFKLINNPSVDWCFKTEPEPGLNGRQMGLPVGRVLGGSSSINGMIYIRGQREDYDGWAQLGNRGWGYDDVLPLFRRSEDQERGADTFHGAGGPLSVSDPRSRFPVVQAFIAAAQEAGLPANGDFNGAVQEGVGPFQLTVRNGRRSSTARSFLRPAMRRGNLTVITDALAHAIVFEGRRAVGVKYAHGGELHEARTAREIVLTAGAIGSPKLLQLSGVGDAAALAGLGIPVVQHLPGVGRNFQDHLQARLVFKTRDPITLNDQARTAWQRMFIGMDYVFRRRGALTFGASLAGAFARTQPGLASPDVQFHFQPLSVDSYDTGLNKFSAFTLSVCQLRPEARGHVRVRSTDPFEPPEMQPNYLSTELDRRAAVAGVQAARAIAATPAMQPFVKREVKPGPGAVSEADLLAFCRESGATIFHPSGTCKMGADALAVLDARLRVHGLAGLRVVDCSAMPTLVSGNTNAPVVMMAEKAVDMIRADARTPQA